MSIRARAVGVIASWSDAQHGPLPPLPLVLTGVTGLVDAVSFLKLGHVFVANMTGNVVFLGFAISDPQDFSVPASIDQRRIDPATAGLQDVDDPADHTPVVGSRHAARVRRKMRREPHKLSIVQPKIISFHVKSPFGSLNHETSDPGIPFMGPEPRDTT